MVIQSFVNYINALSLYVISFTMTTLSIDQYYSLVMVFNNPLDKVSTCFLIKIIWLASSILSIVFLITDKVYYYDYRTRSLVCSQCENYLLIEIKTFATYSTSIRIILQYIIPALLIFVFSFRTVVHLLKKYFQNRGTGIEKTIVFKLFLIFLIFIATNSAFHMTSIKILIFNFKETSSYSCIQVSQNFDVMYMYYMFLLSCLIHPIIYFWFSKTYLKLFYTHILQRRSGNNIHDHNLHTELHVRSGQQNCPQVSSTTL